MVGHAVTIGVGGSGGCVIGEEAFGLSLVVDDAVAEYTADIGIDAGAGVVYNAVLNLVAVDGTCLGEHCGESCIGSLDVFKHIFLGNIAAHRTGGGVAVPRCGGGDARVGFDLCE